MKKVYQQPSIKMMSMMTEMLMAQSSPERTYLQRGEGILEDTEGDVKVNDWGFWED